MKKRAELKREEVRQILKRHVGSITEIASKLQVRTSTVSSCLQDRLSSQRIYDAAHSKAVSLLEKERRSAGAA